MAPLSSKTFRAPFATQSLAAIHHRRVSSPSGGVRTPTSRSSAQHAPPNDLAAASTSIDIDGIVAAASDIPRETNITLHDSATHSSPTKILQFFRLPGELRNKIYRYAILRDTPMRVASTGYTRSGLVRVSKRIRSETLQIFYCENEFLIGANAYNSDTLLQFTQVWSGLQLKVIDQRPVQMRLTFGSHIWANILIWLERYHRGEVIAGFLPPGQVSSGGVHYGSRIVLGGLFDMALELRDLPWERVKKLLLGQRPILVHADARWAQD